MQVVLGVIPARGGSKGIPGKNLRMVGGKPLISWTIDAALNASCCDAVIVSTDSVEIAQTAEKYGVKCPSLRPANLSDDMAKTVDVLNYEILNFETRNSVAVTDVVLLQPTCPLRSHSDIVRAWEIYNNSARDSLISVYNASAAHPDIMYQEHAGRLVSLNHKSQPSRRQDASLIYLRNGAIYIAKRDLIVNERKILSDDLAFYEMPRARSVNIDEFFDLELADWLLSRAKNEHTQP